nr:MAG TPA: minor capsid protein [Caudoviricetes sp.]
MTRSANDLYSAHQMKKQNKYDLRHKRNIKVYELQMDAIYRDAIREAVSVSGTVGHIKPDNPFSFDDYPITRKRIESLMSGLKSRMETVVLNGIKAEWTLANNKNSELANRVFGENVGKLTQAQYRRYYSTNDAARQAFQQRNVGGLNLSDRVWRYTEQFKEEIEMGLDIGIRSGRSADEMSRDLRQYLKQPDKLFRRVRDEHGQLQLSKRAKAYHPGQGVYRSSYKNARRLAATETNIAYRTSDHLRWQQMNFVVGIEIHLSNNHTLNGKPFHDICDELAGKYPKDFKFTGLHPHCRCYATPILKTQEEIAKDMQKILNGEAVDDESVNRVDDVPQVFKDWLTENDERIQRASSVPYFMSDNTKYTGVQPSYGAVGAVTGTKLGRAATKAAFKVYEDMPAPTLTQEVRDNTAAIASSMGIKTPPKPMPFLDANEGRSNVSYGKGDEFAANCQAAVAVHEARLRGLNVTSLGYDSSTNSVSYQLGEHFENIWQHPKTGKTPTPTMLRAPSFDNMLGKIDTATKAVGRYHIGINMSGNRGHVITAERFPDGRIMFYDAQNGAFLKLEEYAVSGVEYFEVLKVDKLILRRDLFKEIARRL